MIINKICYLLLKLKSSEKKKSNPNDKGNENQAEGEDVKQKAVFNFNEEGLIARMETRLKNAQASFNMPISGYENEKIYRGRVGENIEEVIKYLKDL